ncbi:hypothetical protein BJV78DRAFT_376624 [Lactifluus subvellereus]|nr:hypothetical protein BJV78DRAFT_376624 [Lactifluus subvellereus]
MANFSLVNSGNDSVNDYIALAARNNGPYIVTTYNSRPLPSPLPYSPQSGPLSPVSSYSPPGYIPFASNPYPASAFTSAPQPTFSSPLPPVFASPPPPVFINPPLSVFASPPPPVFASPPQPVFVSPLPPAFASLPYGITYVYNTVPQPQLQSNDTELCRVLRIAASVLVPLLMGSVGLPSIGFGAC